MLHSRTHDFKLLFDEDGQLQPTVSELSGLTELRALYPAGRPVVYLTLGVWGEGADALLLSERRAESGAGGARAEAGAVPRLYDEPGAGTEC